MPAPRELLISTATNRRSTSWTNTYTDQHELIAKLCHPKTINITTAEYHHIPKTQKDELKDNGGFVGGHLKNGRRKKGNIYQRSFITLDIDNAPHNLTEQLKTTWPFGWFATTTASHTPDNPRWRIFVWLHRDVTPDEYTAIARRIAEDANPGHTWFDHTTFEPERMMYWPAVCTDGEFLTDTSTKPDLDPDTFLARYKNWMDATTWPGTHTETIHQHQHQGTKVQDPREKPGLIGAFCRTYTIHDAITTFLPDVYKPGTHKNRYTYTHGSSANGLIVYDGGLHAYSQHATDPTNGTLVNAFDLVRIHKYGHLDDTSKPNTPVNKLPSYQAMTELIDNDGPTKLENARTQMAHAQEVFNTHPTNTTDQTTASAQQQPPAAADTHDEWLAQLETKKDGSFADTLNNWILIFTHDPKLNHISYNEHAERLEVQDPSMLPWRQLKPGWTDNDDAQLRAYISATYFGLYGPTKMTDGLTACATARAFHPVRDFFNTLPPWDGVERVDTLLVDTLGAEDTPYVRAVTRKTLVAAVRRTFRPGCKFDHVLTLVGPQGVGKSTIFARLGGQWFSDALTITDMRDKTGAEKLLGNLIVEIAELAGMRKMDAETVKGFVSRTDDKYRAAYGRTVESHPRQGIIVGSTNATEGFLRDPTGNRRWWTVNVTGHGIMPVQDLTSEQLDQIWAEAKHYEKQGERLFLEGDIALAALDAQAEAVEADDRTGIVAEYLDTPLPDSWNEIPLTTRRLFLATGRLSEGAWDTMAPIGELHPRTSVSKIEIWTECFGRDPDSMRKIDSHEITAIMQQLEDWRDTGRSRRINIYGKQRIFERTNVRMKSDGRN
ncbi:VapE domain-containing protein [Corynebacterium macclintockiae]|uniref:VapE domain-containing protein n=1 Tax=Corynebacterium macclintockiae TaxID=2913501 RepID=UPI003EBDB6E5